MHNCYTIWVSLYCFGKIIIVIVFFDDTETAGEGNGHSYAYHLKHSKKNTSGTSDKGHSEKTLSRGLKCSFLISKTGQPHIVKIVHDCVMVLLQIVQTLFPHCPQWWGYYSGTCWRWHCIPCCRSAGCFPTHNPYNNYNDHTKNIILTLSVRACAASIKQSVVVHDMTWCGVSKQMQYNVLSKINSAAVSSTYGWTLTSCEE